MSWLVLSVVLSVVLTVALNLGLRAFPTRRTQAFDESRRVRVFFPWKAMLIGSIALTVLVNVFAALAR